ncbi:hypothetical protein D8I24_2658 (plasmid) [Cupriavidus necator H850]|uniref:hypothetical protein n=1 Tax=Cupriavidus necator TaxID=106590 RepID=UPI00129E9D40|nr:hypothetical protein [Cupriavidus necator]KAI3604953.1 hypothetical protein D8I24_2658 [Cupriavidus necator H850]
MNTKLVSSIEAVARSRLATISADACLVDVAKPFARELCLDYRIVGLDLKSEGADFPVLEADFTSDAAVELALWKFHNAFGSRIASVILCSYISTLPGTLAQCFLSARYWRCLGVRNAQAGCVSVSARW